MSNQTVFYILGISLVVSALIVSAVGLRLPSFPPNRGVLTGVVVFFVALVAATATFAVLNAQDEQAKTEAEAAAEFNSTGTTSTTASSTTSTTATTTTGGHATATSKTSSTSAGSGGTVAIS